MGTICGLLLTAACIAVNMLYFAPSPSEEQSVQPVKSVPFVSKSANDSHDLPIPLSETPFLQPAEIIKPLPPTGANAAPPKNTAPPVVVPQPVPAPAPKPIADQFKPVMNPPLPAGIVDNASGVKIPSNVAPPLIPPQSVSSKPVTNQFKPATVSAKNTDSKAALSHTGGDIWIDIDSALEQPLKY